MSDVLDIPTERIRVISRRVTRAALSASRLRSTVSRDSCLLHGARAEAAGTVAGDAREEHLMSVSRGGTRRDRRSGDRRDQGGPIACLARPRTGWGTDGDVIRRRYWGYLMPFLGAALLPNAYDLTKCDIKIRVALAPTKRCFRRRAHSAPIPHVLPFSGRSTDWHTVWTRTCGRSPPQSDSHFPLRDGDRGQL